MCKDINADQELNKIMNDYKSAWERLGNKEPKNIKEAIENVMGYLTKYSEDLDPEIVKIVDDRFWDLTGGYYERR